MKPPKQQGLMATSNRSNTPILNRLRKSFEPSKPLTLEERLAQLTEIEMQWLTSNASMLQTIMYMRTQVGDFSLDYLRLYNHMYPRDMNFGRQELLGAFLNEVAPLDWEPHPYVKPDYTATLEDWINPFDVNRIEREAREKYAPKPARAKKNYTAEYQDKFLQALAQSESSNNPNAEITIKDGRKFVGALQFGQARLDDYMAATGKSFTQDEFKASSALQEEVAAWHVNDLDAAIDALGDAAERYSRTGLLAAAHIAGKGGMAKWVKTGGEYNPSDELGTSVSDYYARFANGGGA